MKRIKRAFIRSFLSSRRRWDTFPNQGNGNHSLFNTMEEDAIKELLGAYQTDLKGQKLKDRMREDPVGALQFAEKELCLYIQERWGKTTVIFLNIREI